MLGLIVLGLMIPRAVESYRSYDRVVNVKGLCEMEVRADKVIALMSSQADLLKKGVVVAGNDWENPVEFKYEGLNEIKTANQGTFTIEDRDSNTPYIKRVRVVTSVTYYLKN